MAYHSPRTVLLELPLWFAALVALADARTLRANDGPGGNSSTQLSGINTRCPAGCRQDSCVLSTSGGYLCTQCQGNLIVNGADGTCSCPTGKYSKGNYLCVDCDKGSFCPGGAYGAADKVTCGEGLTTMGKRTLSKWGCVNTPGSYYQLDATGSAVAVTCPENTYSPGLKKQRACVPCPPGLSTGGKTGRTSVHDCGIPPGWFLKGPGSVAPCPHGEYKEGMGQVPYCTKCPAGVTTVAEASTSIAACKVLQPGYYPYAMVGDYVATSQLCPQKYVCPGGIPTAAFDPLVPDALNGTTVVLCPSGSWTQSRGSSSIYQCMTPPGFQTVNGSTTECPEGSFRAEWVPVTANAMCTSCGEGFFAEASAEIDVYPITPNSNATILGVCTTTDSCYAQGGQGILFNTMTNTYKAVDCGVGLYGMVNKTFGRMVFPCRPCGEGFTSNTLYPESAKYYVDYGNGRGGFNSNKACVLLGGWGLTGHGAERCAVGSWNAPGSTGSCIKCHLGTSTLNDANAQMSADNCTLAPGFGFHDNVVMACPVGTYNDVLRDSPTAPCKACPTGLTTSQTGGLSVADCNVCAPGYGSVSCSQACGGPGGASFGPPGMPKGSPCMSCPDKGTGFSFDYLGSNLPYQPAAVARLGASSPADCLSEFAQIQDAAWYMGGTAALVNVTAAVANVSSFDACVADCQADSTCQYLTFDYDAGICWKKVAGASTTGDNLIAYKGVTAGDVSAGAASTNTNHRAAKALSSGSYTFWRDNSNGVGTEIIAKGPMSSVQACLNLCDADDACAAVVMASVTSATAAPTSCNLIRGNSQPGVFKRGLTKTNVSRLTVDSALQA